MSRTSVEIRTADGVCPASVFKPSGGQGPWHGVLLFMDGPGIRPALFDMGQRMADAGYVVLLPDLFYRAGPYEPNVIADWVANPQKRAAWFKSHFSSTHNVKAAEDVKYFLDFLVSEPDVKPGKIGTTGYCMGAGMSLTAAGMHPDRIAASAGFHGGGLATDSPTSPHTFAPRIKARVYQAIADKDQFMSVEQMETLRQALAAAGVDHRVELYEGALHGWTMPDTPIYNADAAERHWRELLKLFQETLH